MENQTLRILGIDLGEKRIGISLCDELGITAQGLPTILSKTEIENIESIKNVISQYHIERVVFGLPVNMNGSIGPQAKKAIAFAEKVKTYCHVPVVMEDERLTTSSAEKILIQGNRSRKKRKKVIDKMSAVIILQTYLDKAKFNKEM